MTGILDGAPFSRIPGRSGERNTIRVNPGGHYLSLDGAELIVTVLGSCVAACMRDPVARVGGMNHFMLPESNSGVWGRASASLRFGNFAMERLINDILSRGGRRQNLEIKVFGGATMIGTGAHVGTRNVAFVESYLHAERLPIAASHLRGAHARRIIYDPKTGRVRMLELQRDIPAVVEIERGYVKSMQAEPATGAIELF